MVERTELRNRSEIRTTYTRLVPLAGFSDPDLVNIAHQIFLQDQPQAAADWERRLYRKYRPIIESGEKYNPRITKPTQEKIIAICSSDSRVVSDLENNHLPILEAILNDLRAKREKSRRYFEDKERKRVLSMLPPGTREMVGADFEQIRQDQSRINPLFRTRLWNGIKELRRLVPAFVTIPAIVLVSAELMGYSQPEPPTPLLRDRAIVHPAPDLTKTASLEIIKAREIAQSTIANFPPKPEEAEILFRIVNERTGKPLEGTVEFDGETAETNESGLIRMKGKTLRSFEALPTPEVLRITLRNGLVVYVVKEVIPGINSTLLKPENGFIRITLPG